MIAQSFQYESPGSLAEAIAMLEKYGDEAKILSGGHSLIPMMIAQKKQKKEKTRKVGSQDGKG